jgi:hypothetical protein
MKHDAGQAAACGFTRWSRHIANVAFLTALTCLFASTLIVLGQDTVKSSGSWSGVIINATCSVDEAFADAEKCTESVPGARLVLYDDTTRHIYDLRPETPAQGHLGDAVTVSGTLEGNTISAASIKVLTSIGLPAGQKAPAFSAHDQFRREQTLETLKGAHGTVLLFFRSADW